MISVAIPLICGLTIVTMFLGILFVVKSWFIFNGGGGGGGSFHENIPICIASCTYCPIHILYVVCWRNAQKMGIFNYYFHCWIVTQVYWIIDSTDSFKNADWFSNSWMCMSVSGFCHFGLVSFMGFVTESLTLPSCPVFMWVRGFGCARAVRSLVCMPFFCVGAWCSDPGTHILSFGFVSGVRTLTLSEFCLIVWVCNLEFARRSSVHVCFVVLHAVRVFIGYVHSCYVFYCVACSLCIHWLRAFMLSCLVFTRRLMSILISSFFVSCFAHGWWFVLLAMYLCFCFVWAHGFVFDFCVPCALMSICLDPTNLVSWLLVNWPHLSSLVTLLICSLYNLLVFAVLCQTELLVILLALQWIEEVQPERTVTCSDSMAALTSLLSGKSEVRQDLVFEVLLNLFRIRQLRIEVNFFWVPVDLLVKKTLNHPQI